MSRARPSGSVVAIVIASLALVTALSGTAYAALVITGANIKNGTVTSADLKNNSVRGVDLKDRSLLGADLLVRVASASADDNAVTGTTAPTPALQTSIKAPVKGFLVITASSDAYSSTDNYADCWIAVDGGAVRNSERSLQFTSASNSEQDCATNTTVAVRAGVHAVALMADPLGADVVFDESHLSVVFVPFDGKGKYPTTFFDPTPRSAVRGN